MSQQVRLSYLVRQVQLATYQGLDQTLRDFGVTPSQYTVLSILNGRRVNLSSAALARRLGITPQSANEIVATLVAAQWVQRAADADNRRTFQLGLTPKGRNRLARCDVEVDRFEQSFFGSLSSGEKELLRGLLERVVTADRTEPATLPRQAQM